MRPLQMRKSAAGEAADPRDTEALFRGFHRHDLTRHPQQAAPPRGRWREEADDYMSVVAYLNAGWRVIKCRDQIQWILQRRSGQRHGQPRWEGKGYFGTKDALIRTVHKSAGQIDEKALHILEALPERLHGFRILATTRQGGAS
jgi:hypothetical protein